MLMIMPVILLLTALITAISIFFMGFITSKFVVFVPIHFQMDGKKAKIISQEIIDADMELVNIAMEKCLPEIIIFK